MNLRVQTPEGLWEDLPPDDEGWENLHKYNKDGELGNTFDGVTKEELRNVFLVKKVTSHVNRPHFWNCPRGQMSLEIARNRLLLGLTLVRDEKTVSIELPKIIKKNPHFQMKKSPRCTPLCEDYVYLYSKSSNELHRSKTKPYLNILNTDGFKCEKCLYFVRGINAKQPHKNDELCTKAKEQRKKLMKLAVPTLDADMPDPEILRQFSETTAKEKRAFANFLGLLSEEKQQEYEDDVDLSSSEDSEDSEDSGDSDDSDDSDDSEDSEDSDSDSEKTLTQIAKMKRKAYNDAQLKLASEAGHPLGRRHKVLKSLFEDDKPTFPIKGNEWVYAAKSEKHGVGLFAKKAIRKDTLIKVFDDWKKFGKPIKFMRYGKRYDVTGTKRIHLGDTNQLIDAGRDIQHEINERLEESYETIKKYWNSLQWKDEATKKLCALPDESGFGVHPYVMHPINETLEGRNDGNVYLQVLKNNQSYWQNVPLFDPVNTCWGLINYSDSPNVVVASNNEVIKKFILEFNTGGAIIANKDIAKDEELLWNYGGKGGVEPDFRAIIEEQQSLHLRGGKDLEDPLLVVKLMDGDIPEGKAEALKPVAMQLLNPALVEKNAMFRLHTSFDVKFEGGRLLKFDSEVGDKVHYLSPHGLVAFLVEVCLCATYELREQSAHSSSSVTDYSLEEAKKKAVQQVVKSFAQNRDVAVAYCQDVLRRFGVEKSVVEQAGAAAPTLADQDEFWLVPKFYAEYDEDDCIERVVAKMCFCSAPGAQSELPDWCVVVFEARRIEVIPF